jgi:hypothetical protein
MKVQHPYTKARYLDTVLKYVYPPPIVMPFLSEIYLTIILPSFFGSSKWPFSKTKYSLLKLIFKFYFLFTHLSCIVLYCIVFIYICILFVYRPYINYNKTFLKLDYFYCIVRAFSWDKGIYLLVICPP